jgi:hypothetical protein
MQWKRGLTGLGLVSVGVGVMLAAQMARAQQQGGCTFTDDSGKTVFWPNCQPPADSKSADEKAPPPNGTTPAQTTTPGSTNPAKSFPFPGGDGSTAPGNGQATTGGQANAPGSPAAGAPAAKKFPFPGEDPAGSGPLRDTGSSGNTPSSSSSSSSSGPPERDPSAGPLGDGDTDPAARAAEARRAARAKKGIEFHQTSDQREAEDLRVAAFYHDDGNFRGMYERASDAVSLADDDAEAHLALAEAARRLGKLDEAMAHYKKCLTLDPVPKTRKAAEKALKEMTAGG